MRHLLDTLYSSDILKYGSIALVTIICAALTVKNPFKNTTARQVFKFTLLGVALFTGSMPFLFYLGYALKFEKMLVGNSTILLFEINAGHEEAITENVCRLHIIDRETGELKKRFYIGGYADLACSRGDTVCYIDRNNVYLYDAKHLKEIYHIKGNDWAGISGDLSAGVEKIEVCRAYAGTKPFVCINAKNGKRYWLEPFSKKISEGSINENTDEKSISYLDLVNTEGKLEIIVPGNKFKHLFHVNDSTAYLEPILLCTDTLNKAFVFCYQTSTDHEGLMFEAKNFEYKTIWKKTSGELGINESELRKIDLELSNRYNSRLNVYELIGGMLYFNYGGYCVALDPLTGKQKWISRS
jgi:hypothetical protein